MRQVSGRGYDVLRFIDEILEILWIEVGWTEVSGRSTYSKSLFPERVT